MKRKLLSLLTLALTSITFGQYTVQNLNVPMMSAAPDRISVVDQNTVWTTIYDGSENASVPRIVAVTSNSGNTWTSHNLTTVPTYSLLSDIAGVDAQKAFVVTAPSGRTTNNANGLYRTTDGGANWAKITGVFSNDSFGNIVHFYNSTTGLAIGDPVNNKYEMYKTTDGGNTWSVLTTAPTPLNEDEYGYVGGKASFGNSLWLTSNTGRILHSTDQGVTWNSYFAPVDDFGSSESNAEFTFSSETTGLLVDNFGILWYTEDAGANWEIKDAVGYYNFKIKYVPGTNGQFISTGIDPDSDLGFGSSYSTDGGETWVNIDSNVQRGNIGVANCANIWVGSFTSSATGTGGILKLNNALPGCTLATSDVNTNKTELKAVVTNGVLSVFTNKDIKDVIVGDMSTRVLVQSTKKDLNVSQLKAGVYYARVAYTDGTFGTVKFVIK